MKIAFQMDPIGAVDIDADTALAILRPIAYRLHADARREPDPVP